MTASRTSPIRPFILLHYFRNVCNGSRFNPARLIGRIAAAIATPAGTSDITRVTAEIGKRNEGVWQPVAIPVFEDEVC
jgi:hypothetical protein